MAATTGTERHPSALPAGYELNGYRIGEQLGAGGFAITYAAHAQLMQAKQVAIKEYLPIEFAHRDEESSVIPHSAGEVEVYQWGLERFVEEANILHKLANPEDRHPNPNIVAVEHIFKANQTAYIVMDWVRGATLAELIERGERFDQPRLSRLLHTMLDALEYIHSHDAIHRDISPANIIINEEDDNPVLIDFGAARSDIRQRVTKTQLFKPGYAPIEQEAGSLQDERSDIYALAATIYHAAFGIKPPRATQRVMAQGEGKADPLRPARELGRERYDDGFLKALDRGLGISREQRPTNAAAWRKDFRAAEARAQAPSSKERADALLARLKTSIQSVPATTIRRAGIAAGGALAVMLLVVGIISLLPGYEQYMERGQQSLATALNDAERADEARSAFESALKATAGDPAAAAGVAAANGLAAYETAVRSGDLAEAEALLATLTSQATTAGVPADVTDAWRIPLNDARLLTDARALLRAWQTGPAGELLEAVAAQDGTAGEALREALQGAERIGPALERNEFRQARADLAASEAAMAAMGFPGANRIEPAQTAIDVAVARFVNTGTQSLRDRLLQAPLAKATHEQGRAFLDRLRALDVEDAVTAAGPALLEQLAALGTAASKGAMDQTINTEQLDAHALQLGLGEGFSELVTERYAATIDGNSELLREAEAELRAMLAPLTEEPASTAVLRTAQAGLKAMLDRRATLPPSIGATLMVLAPLSTQLADASEHVRLGAFTEARTAFKAVTATLDDNPDLPPALRSPIASSLSALQKLQRRGQIESNRLLGRAIDLVENAPFTSERVQTAAQSVATLLERYPQEPNGLALATGLIAWRTAVEAGEACAPAFIDRINEARGRWPAGRDTEFMDMAIGFFNRGC